MRRHIMACLIFGIVCTSAQPMAQEANPSWPMPPGIKYEAVNGYPMAFRDVGVGTPVVLVHGSTNDYRAWNAQIDAFGAQNRVITVSLRHYYPEQWDGSGTTFSIEQHARDVVALIKKLKLGRVHLVGHSRGGGVVVEVAKSNPEVIRTLVLADGAIQMPVPEIAEARQAAEFTRRLIGTLQENLKAGNTSKAAEVFVDMLNKPGTWPTLPEAAREMILTNLYTAMGDKSRPLTSCAAVGNFDFPVLLMTADGSPRVYEFFYNEMRKCRADLPKTVVIPKAGHAMQRNNPEVFNRTVLTFIAQH